MKKVMIMLLLVVCLAVPTAVFAEPPTKVEGDFTYTPTGCNEERWANDNQFLSDCHDVGIWKGDFVGDSTEVYEVIFFGSEGDFEFDHAFYKGIVTFDGTVEGKTGKVTFMMQGISPKPGDVAYWTGTWRIMGGTGELANIHGNGVIYSNGLLDVHYEGQIHFSP